MKRALDHPSLKGWVCMSWRCTCMQHPKRYERERERERERESERGGEREREREGLAYP